MNDGSVPPKRRPSRMSGLSNIRPQRGTSDASRFLENEAGQPKVLNPADSGRDLPDDDAALLQIVADKIATTARLVDELRSHDAVIEWLGSVPGIGGFASCLIHHEVKDIRRFATTKHLVSHSGLAPSSNPSGTRVRRADGDRPGNKWLNWAFTQAVAPAIRDSPSIHRYYDKIRARRGASDARVATARKLAELVWTVWTERRCYEERESRGSRSPSALDVGFGPLGSLGDRGSHA